MTLRFTLSDVAKGFVDTILREMQRPIAKPQPRRSATLAR
jgi:hypothetical protein